MTAQVKTKISKFPNSKNMPALAHLLPYWEFLENCVVFVDGSLGAGFYLEGIDLDTADDETVNQQIQGLRTLLNNLPDGIDLQFLYDIHSNYDDLIGNHKKSSLPGQPEISQRLTEARVSGLEEAIGNQTLFRNSIFAFLRYEPQREATRQFKIFETVRKFRQRKEEEHQSHFQAFSHIIQSFEENLSSVGIIPYRLTTEELRQKIYAVLNPNRCIQFPVLSETRSHLDQVFTPEEQSVIPMLSLPSPRDQLLYSDLSFDENSLYLDDYFHRFITLKVTPEFTHAACIQSLLNLPFHFTLSLNIHVPEQSKELSALEQKRKMAHALTSTKSDQPRNLEGEARLHDTEGLIQEILTTGQKIFYVELGVILKAKEMRSLEQMTRMVLGKFREMNGAEGLVESYANLHLWKSTLPGGGFPQVRSRRMKTDNLADFLPLYEPHPGSKKPICLFQNRQGGLIKYDPFADDLPNFSALVTGSSGAGKSFLNNCILLQYLSQNPLVSIIDIGGSYRKLVEILGGTYLSVSLNKDHAINPFDLPKGEVRPSNRKIKSFLAILETIFSEEESGGKLTKLDRNLLEQAIVETYEKNTTDLPPTLSAFCRILENSDEQSLKRFAKMLYSWTGDRPYGELLDRQSALQSESAITCFDLNGLEAYPDLQGAMILIITDYILNQIESLPDRRKLIIMDECWQFLKTPSCVGFMEYCVRTLRKSGSGIVFITQGLEEIVQSPIASAILNNTANKFILLQRGDLDVIKRHLKLNDYEIELIHSLKQKKGEFSEAFWINNNRHQIIRVAPTPLEYWIATTDNTDHKLFRQYAEQHPEWSQWDRLCQLAKDYPRGNRS